MHTGIIYYSETGNTKLIAEAISKQLINTEILTLKEFSGYNLNQKDLWFLGMPVHSNNLPDSMKVFFNETDFAMQPVAVFFTHTGIMEDTTVKIFLKNLDKIITSKKINLIGTWHCRGENKRRDILEWIRLNKPDRYPHALTASGLPAEKEIREARIWAESLLRKVQQEG